MLLDDIREGFANLTDGAIGQLRSLPPAWPGWVYRADGAYGVALDLSDPIEVAESFAGARLFVASVQLPEGRRSQLRFECSRASLRNEFAVVCAQFLEPGVAGADRTSLLAKPVEWWERWRQLLGNVLREKMPHAVLGELLAFERLRAMKEAPAWLGPKSSSHDLETPMASYEVKSTLSKYESTVHIAGQFQLKASGDKPLFLVFQRFEPSATGESIDAVVGRLVETGVDREDLEGQLAKLGFHRGSSSRKASFQLLESTKYLVDETFPRITPSLFPGGSLPPGIVALQYDVDLAALKGTSF